MSNYNQVPDNLPVPKDDGACDHLDFKWLPNLALSSTSGGLIQLQRLPGLSVIFIYPMTGVPGTPLPAGWDEIPGARGCTPQSCSFRDLHEELKAQGVDHVFGLSSQSTDYQKEAAERLHLPYSLLSDDGLKLHRELDLPIFTATAHDGTPLTLYKRVTLIVRDGEIIAHFYPVFPTDQSAQVVLDHLIS